MASFNAEAEAEAEVEAEAEAETTTSRPPSCSDAASEPSERGTAAGSPHKRAKERARILPETGKARRQSHASEVSAGAISYFPLLPFLLFLLLFLDE